MAITPLSLKTSVGRDGMNSTEDVRTVQTALGLLKPKSSAPPYFRGQADGRSGPMTETAITLFQLANRERATGSIRNGDATHRKIMEAVGNERTWAAFVAGRVR